MTAFQEGNRHVVECIDGMRKPLLEIKNLKTYFYTDEGISKAVDGVDLVLNRGEILGIIGESGSGKSVTALSIIRLVASPPGKIISGEIWFEGDNLLEKSADEIRRIRGNEISIIFQEPMTSLNPVLTIGDQIMENIITHQKLNKPRARRQAIEMLKLVGIPSPQKRIDEYPHQLSGGMRQRAALLRTLMEERPVILMDEPFSALDALTRLKLQNLAARLVRGATVLLVTHDPWEALRIGHRIYIMKERPVRLSRVFLPPGTPPRTPDREEIAAMYAQLLAHLVEKRN